MNSPEPAASSVDLTNCDREPIHIPGSVQPHATLLVLEEPGLVVRQATTNVSQTLGIPHDQLLGTPLAMLVSAADLAHLHKVLTRSLDAAPHFLPALSVGKSPRPFEAQIHRFKGALILELEDWPERAPVAAQETFAILQQDTLSHLQGSRTVIELCQRAAERVRDFIGFDRVMVYRFDEDLSGNVIAEARRSDLESYLGLHYPASDIPRQARELFRLSKLRLIPDLRYAPVPVQPTLRPDTGEPLDMSFCVTRSVSPIHVEYLQNMGVDASLSLSVVIDDKLWGLFACHHYSPRYVPHAMRMSCIFLAQTLCFLVDGREEAEAQGYRARLLEHQRRLDQAIALTGNFHSAATRADRQTLGGIDADGAAIVTAGEMTLLGRTPPLERVRALVQDLSAMSEPEVWATDRISESRPALAAHVPEIAGLLAARVGRNSDSFLLWFRAEVLQTVNWAGDPTKAITPGPLGDRLTPRKSFALWQQEVRGRSRPWAAAEREAAHALRHSYIELYARHAHELAELNAKLADRNQQLDAFAYIASHDLKEPLRGIHNFSKFLLEDFSGQLDAEGVKYLGTIVQLTRRMESLLDSLLKYSRLSQSEMHLHEVNLDAAVSDALELLPAIRQANPAEIRRPRPLPAVKADANLMTEVFLNLISNALKYHDKPDGRWVEIGWQEGEAGHPPIFYVSDNGIGIAPEHHEQIFRIFRRLHGRESYGGGTGAGLTIAQKLIERHGGKLWLESTPGSGSRFSFTLAPDPSPP